MICFDCGATADHQHHVVPKSMGGTATVPLCESCHGKVHGRTFLHHRTLTREALARKKARGEKAGGAAPFGFSCAADGKTLIKSESEQAIITAVHELRSRGLSIRKIVLRLSQLGVVGRTGRPLAITQVQRILSGAAGRQAS